MIKKAFITGASSGIGEALARLLAQGGCSLVLLGRDEAVLQSLQNELEKKVTVEIHSLDLCNEASLGRACELVATSEVDLVINCAGIGFYGRAVDLEMKEQQDILKVNISSLVALTIASCKAWQDEEKRGSEKRERIVCNISSALGFVPCPLMSVYSASKAFVNNFSQAIDGEMSSFGIRILAACPGQVATRFRFRAAKGEKTSGGSAFFTMDTMFVAEKILQQIKRQKPLCIIDWKTKFLVGLTYLLPKRLIQRILLKRVPHSSVSCK